MNSSTHLLIRYFCHPSKAIKNDVTVDSRFSGASNSGTINWNMSSNWDQRACMNPCQFLLCPSCIRNWNEHKKTKKSRFDCSWILSQAMAGGVWVLRMKDYRKIHIKTMGIGCRECS